MIGSIRRIPAIVTITATSTDAAKDSVNSAFALRLLRCPLAIEMLIAPPIPNRKNSACIKSTTGSARLIAEKALSPTSAETTIPSTNEASNIDIELIMVGKRYSLNFFPSSAGVL